LLKGRKDHEYLKAKETRAASTDAIQRCTKARLGRAAPTESRKEKEVMQFIAPLFLALLGPDQAPLFLESHTAQRRDFAPQQQA